MGKVKFGLSGCEYGVLDKAEKVKTKKVFQDLQVQNLS